MRTDWDTVYRMSAIEFLNVICYIRDKTEEERAAMEKWQKKH